MNYYKFINELSSEVLLDTDKVSDESTLSDKEAYKNLLGLITQFSKKQDLPLDFYTIVNNNLALWGNMYLENLPLSKDGKFELSQLTYRPSHDGLFIQEAALVEFIEHLDKIGINVFKENSYLWEFIFEEVRANQHSDKPSREKSFFLFDSFNRCNDSIANHKEESKICEVELLEIRHCFKADRSFFDLILNNYSYRQTAQQADQYWMGKISENPKFEYLFQGICKLKL
jgi:hypothetical protein